MGATFQDLLDIYPTFRRRIISAICQTLLYGIYLCLVPIAIHIMVTNGLQSRARKWLLALTTFIFALSTVEWIFSIITGFICIDWWSSTVVACYDSDDVSSCIVDKMSDLVRSIPGLEIIDNLILINYIIADSIMVWRAWVLCSDQRRVVLMIPVVMLVINTIIYLVMVVLTVIDAIWLAELRQNNLLQNIFTGTQVAHLSFSLLINISATSIITLKAWRYRKLLAESGIGIRSPTQAIKVLALLVESGAVYILISVASLIPVIICLSSGLGDISTMSLRMNAQLVGMYPIIVVLLVEKNRSLNSTFGSFGTIIDVRGVRMEPMSFAPRPVLASGRQIDSATNPPNADIQVHIAWMEPEDAE